MAFQNLAFQDWVALSFHGYNLLRASTAPHNHAANTARTFALTLFATTAMAIFAARAELIANEKLRAFVYRTGLFIPMISSYFLMGFLLHGLQPALFDDRLLAIDLLMFETTPAIWFEQFNVRPVVEWFSFFYFSYFFWLVVMIIPPLYFAPAKRLAPLMIGAAIICAAGHVTYSLVPGVGPVSTLAFAAPIDGGFWWSEVQRTVQQAGAKLDIFPSLHTAYPLFFTLYAWSNRDNRFYRWLFPVIAFFSLNIMIATLFLRWHWFIDVVAGVALAVFAWQMSLRVSAREARRGEDDDRQPVWEPLFR